MIMNKRKRRKCMFWSGVVGSITTVLVVVAVRDVLLASSLICTTYDIINNHISSLCSETNLLGGQELCRELCVDDIASKITCHTFHLNKPAVFTLDNGSKKVIKAVIKMEDQKVPMEEVSGEEEEVYWKLKKSKQYFPRKEELLNMVNVHVKNFLGNEVSPEVINKLVNHSHLYQSEKESLDTHRNFWLLIEDHEFLTAVIFEKLKIFPSILGTCGTYYSMQHFEPLTKNAMRPFKLTWRNRIWKGLDILRYISHLETIWREPLHLCDVKHDHFGWDHEGNLVFLDLDAVMPESSLLRTMESTPHCSGNDDCSYFDCMGRCHLRTSKCELERTNTNLQVVCDKVFLGNTEGLLSLYGLLVSEEATGELVEALELCKTNRGMTIDGMMDVLTRASNALMY
ncbi:hypothetical protein Pcinc_011580 [Petrolisthes cinctipes]|uniref:Protein FAM69C n=1 Tax=Petrolisthes cinctipes TaxID=88211 RepID=A0AAE1KTB4_PETCI|nr:hypothetical protein Pcinc_011580 [Petrolisthes cinctipes]